MSEPITPDELVSRVEGLHDEIKTLRAAVHGTGSGPNSNELHDFLAGLDKHLRVSTPNLSAYKNWVQGRQAWPMYRAEARRRHNGKVSVWRGKWRKDPKDALAQAMRWQKREPLAEISIAAHDGSRSAGKRGRCPERNADEKDPAPSPP